MILTSFNAEGAPVTVPATKRITLRQLLTHTAGMAYEALDPQLSAWRENTPEGKRTYDDAFMSKYLMPLIYEPGESWMYSQSIDWVGKLVERANNSTLEAYMQQHIWDPLGIQDITFHLEKKERVKRNAAEMTARVPESGLLVPGENEYFIEQIGYEAGGAGLWSSAPDYLKVLSSILRDDGKLVKSESVAEMFKAQLSPATLDSWNTNPSLALERAGAEFTWGLGGKYNLEDVAEGRRKKGSLGWGGFPNLVWVCRQFRVYNCFRANADWWKIRSGLIQRLG